MNAGPAVVAELKPCEGAQPLATVGREWILAAEVLGVVNEILAQNKERLAALTPSQLEQQRQALIQQSLQQRIQTKLIFLDATRTIPPENMPDVEKQIGGTFEQAVVPMMIKRGELKSRQELEAKLRAFGTSLERQKRSFIEEELAKEWLRRQIDDKAEISREAMWKYYEAHAEDYEIKAQARWEQLTVRLSDYPSKAEAWAALAAMGNEVLAGKPLADVAKAGSKGPTASKGGVRDWTCRGSLVSKALDASLFELPIGKLSQILEDERELHIVRVIERKEAGRTPFEEVQAEIREKLREERHNKQVREYLTRLRKEIPIRTVFDTAATGSAPGGEPQTSGP